MGQATGCIPISYTPLHIHVIHAMASRFPKHMKETLYYSPESSLRLLSSQCCASRLSHLPGISHLNKII